MTVPYLTRAKSGTERPEGQNKLEGGEARRRMGTALRVAGGEPERTCIMG